MGSFCNPHEQDSTVSWVLSKFLAVELSSCLPWQTKDGDESSSVAAASETPSQPEPAAPEAAVKEEQEEEEKITFSQSEKEKVGLPSLYLYI